MANANTADFFGGSSAPIAKAKIYAPGEEPNPKNPGGISNNELKRRQKADEIKRLDQQRAVALAKSKAATSAKIVQDQKEASAAMRARTGGLLGDLKVLGPVVLKAAGTAAAVVATGGAAAGAIGLTAAAGVTAAATTASKVIDAVNTGQKVISSVKKGDVAGVASAAQSGLSQAGIKTPALPTVADLGGKAVAGLSLPKLKVGIPDPKKELAAAKQAASSAGAALKTVATSTAKAAVKTVTAAAPKIAPPKAAPAKLVATAASNVFAAAKAAAAPASSTIPNLLKAAAAAPSNLRATMYAAVDRAAGMPAGTVAKLSELQRGTLAKIPGAKLVMAKNGSISVSTPAAATMAADLFKPAASAAASAVKGFTTTLAAAPKTLVASAPAYTAKQGANVPANGTIMVKASAPKPPAMATTKPPKPSPSVASTITTTATASKPPVIRPPGSVMGDASSGPVREGFFVGLDGTIDFTTRRFRAA